MAKNDCHVKNFTVLRWQKLIYYFAYISYLEEYYESAVQISAKSQLNFKI